MYYIKYLHRVMATDTDYGFIITRHVTCSKTNKYWNQCVKVLRVLYPSKQIVIIDDNSDYSFVEAEFDYKNIQIIQSEFPKRGELLPYYYLLKHQFFANAVIIHDSVFFHKRINFETFVKRGIKVLPLWFFPADDENITNTLRIIQNLRNPQIIQDKLTLQQPLLRLMPNNKWNGCFGVQSYINLQFLKHIETKYHLLNLVGAVHSRADRCCLERIFGCIFCTESPNAQQQQSLLGNIFSYCTWGYTFDEYMENFQKGHAPKIVVKVWTGR